MKAVIVIDMVNDFFLEGNLCGCRNTLVRNINKLLSACRESNYLIIWIRQEFEPDLSDAFKVMKAHNTRITIKGTPGCEILPDLKVSEIDPVVIKKRYSAFFGTNLDQLLEENQIKELILCGINTHACVRTTAIDAYQRDFSVYLPKDCVNSSDPEHHDISLKYLGRFIAKVVHSDHLIARLDRMRSLSYRPAAEVDYDSVRNRAYNNMIDIVRPIWKEWKEDSFRNCYDSRSNFLVNIEDKTIGHIGVKVSDMTLRIQDIQIDYDWQSQGYGSQCMEWIEKYAQDKQCSEIELVVFKNNAVAYNFYSKLGYKVRNEHEHSLVLVKQTQQDKSSELGKPRR